MVGVYGTNKFKKLKKNCIYFFHASIQITTTTTTIKNGTTHLQATTRYLDSIPTCGFQHRNVRRRRTGYDTGEYLFRHTR